jgi:hypothetical protein
MSELITCLEMNLNFTSPFGYNSVFSDTSINKLKKLLHNYTTSSPDILDISRKLYDTICKVQSMNLFNDEPTKKLRFTYRILDNDTKKSMLKALNNLLYSGLYMRGWIGPGHQYPIDEAIVTPDRIAQVDINVSQSIEEYNKSIRILGNIGEQIDNLPLVQYIDGHYHLATRKSQGLTIRDRLNIVTQGENTDNIESCIRMSSNWICATAHKYITALIGQPPFDIYHLRLIR